MNTLHSGEAAARILSQLDSEAAVEGHHRALTRPMRPVAALADVIAVASTARFRAANRTRLRESARYGLVIVVGTALLDILVFGPLHPTAFVLIAGLNIVVAAVAAMSAVATTTRAGRQPEALVIVTLLTVDAATIAIGVAYRELGMVAIGYLLLLPTIVALVVQWTTRIHVAWLAGHALAVLWYASFVTEPLTDGGTRGDLILLLIVATAVSLFGHLAALQSRVVGFVQIERIKALNRQARRDEARLDRMNALLEQSAMTDELTGLKNRLSLRLDLRVIRGRMARQPESYGLLVLDLDRFKAINDLQGHVAGDAVLRAIATAFVGALRIGDDVYRYGGEEFVALVRVATPDDAVLAAERMRRAVEDLHIGHPGNPPYGRVTVSVGVAVFGPADTVIDDDAWIARADVALYRAKALGRDRTEATIGTVPSA